MPEPRRFTGQVAVVTGASGGIGAAIARQLAAAGAAVCLAARRKGRIESLAGELSRAHGVPTLAVVADVTDRASVKACVREAEGALGPVSVLVSNAGVMHYTLMKNLHEDEWAQAVDVNCKGMLNAVGAVLPGMLSRGRGHILTITSDAGRKAFPGLSVYSGTKFFNEAVSQGLRAECVGTGVKVTTVQPGDCRSELPACTTDEEARARYAQRPRVSAPAMHRVCRSSLRRTRPPLVLLTVPVSPRATHTGLPLRRAASTRSRPRTATSGSTRSTSQTPSCGPCRSRRTSRSAPGRRSSSREGVTRPTTRPWHVRIGQRGPR